MRADDIVVYGTVNCTVPIQNNSSAISGYPIGGLSDQALADCTVNRAVYEVVNGAYPGVYTYGVKVSQILRNLV